MPITRKLAFSVATQSSTTNRVKNISDEPRSFSPTITITVKAHAITIGNRYWGSGRLNGPTRQVPAAISSRRSVR